MFPKEPGRYITASPTEEYVVAVRRDLVSLMDAINPVLSQAKTQGTTLFIAQEDIRKFEDQETIKLPSPNPSIQFLINASKFLLLAVIIGFGYIIVRRKLQSPSQSIPSQTTASQRNQPHSTPSQQNSPQNVIYVSTHQQNQPDMSENYRHKYDQSKAQIGGIVDTAQSGSHQQFTQNNYISEERRTLADAANEIQCLLKQLEETNSAATEAEQVAFINIATNSDFKQRVIAALREGGETAIDEFVLENKYLKVVKAVVKGWLTPNS